MFEIVHKTIDEETNNKSDKVTLKFLNALENFTKKFFLSDENSLSSNELIITMRDSGIGYAAFMIDFLYGVIKEKDKERFLDGCNALFQKYLEEVRISNE